MKSTRTILLFVLTTFLHETFAQLEKIPANANTVIVFNLQTLNKKVDFGTLNKYSFLKGKDSITANYQTNFIRNFSLNPKKNGINEKGKIVYFSTGYNYNSKSAIVFPIANRKATIQFLETFHKKLMLNQNRDENSYYSSYYTNDTIIPRQYFKKEKDGVFYLLYPDERFALALTQNQLILITSDYFSTYDFNTEYSTNGYEYNRMADSIAAAYKCNYYSYSKSSIDRAVDAAKRAVDAVKITNQNYDAVGVEEPNLNYIAPNIDEKAIQDSAYSLPDTMVPSQDSVIEEIQEIDTFVALPECETLPVWKQFQKDFTAKRIAYQHRKYLNYFNETIDSFAAYLKISPFNNLISNNKEVATKLNNENDVTVWQDYTHFVKMVFDEAFSLRVTNSGNYYDYKRKIKFNKPYEKTETYKYLGNAYAINIGNFENGKIALTNQIHGSDSLLKLIQSTYKSNSKSNILDLIKTDNVPALLKLNIQLESIPNFYYNLIIAMRKDFEQFYSEHKSDSVFKDKDIDIFFTVNAMAFNFYNMLDKNMLYHTFSGEMMAATTGTRRYVTEYTTYDYDVEGNRTPITKTREMHMPVFLVAIELKNAENFDKLLQPWIDFGFIKYQNSKYTSAANDEIKMFFDFAVVRRYKNYLILSNDSLYNNDAYLSRPGQLNANIIAKANNYSQYVSTNSNGIFDLLRGLNMNPSILETFKRITESMVSMESYYSGITPSDGITTIEFKNKSNNSLAEMLELIEALSK